MRLRQAARCERAPKQLAPQGWLLLLLLLLHCLRRSPGEAALHAPSVRRARHWPLRVQEI